MSYSQKHNLLFLHIPKNAGKSVEASLGIISEQETRSYEFRSPLNRGATWLQRKTCDPAVEKRLFGTLDRSFCAQHLTLQEIQLLELLTTKQLTDANKISVIRNPFSRAVSTYKHFNTKANYSAKHFHEFWQRWGSSELNDHNQIAHRRSQVDFLRNLSGKILDCRLLRFENLNFEFANYSKSELRVELRLPHLGASAKTDYKDFYDGPAKRWIGSRFEEDLDKFHYVFSDAFKC